jgi:hypothetical protein
MWCAAETVAKACERTGFEIHSHVGNAPMEQLSGVCAVPAYRPPDGQGKKGLKEQDDDMFGLTPNFRCPTPLSGGFSVAGIGGGTVPTVRLAVEVIEGYFSDNCD